MTARRQDARAPVPATVRVLALSLAVLGCVEELDTRVENRRPFTPPEIYAEWWGATEACAGRAGDFGRIRWSLASAIWAEGRVARARWTPPHDIDVVDGYQDDETVVRHEMLHDLLAGDAGHASDAWDACALRGA